MLSQSAVRCAPRILTCAAPSYLAARGRPVHPEELGNGRHDCILFRDPATGRPFPWAFMRGGEEIEVPVTGRLVRNDSATMLAACLARHGIVQAMELGIHQLVADGRLVVLFPDWSDERFPLYAI